MVLWETITWIALPNGRDGNTLKLSLFLSLRLEAHEDKRSELQYYSDVTDWPLTIQNMVKGIKVEFSTLPWGSKENETSDRISPNVSLSNLNSELWKKLFPPDTPTKPFLFKDLASSTIHTYPVRDLMTEIKSTYINTAVKSPVVLPKYSGGKVTVDRIDTLLRSIGSIEAYQKEFLNHYDASVVTSRDNNKPPVYDRQLRRNSLSSESVNYFLPYRFFHRPELTEITDTPPAETPIDFHQMIASLGDHPEILRQLGLIIDLTIPWNNSISGSAFVRFVLNEQGPKPFGPEKVFQAFHICPWTACTIAIDRFVPRPKPYSPNSPHREWMTDLDATGNRLNLKSGGYDIVQLDQDGAAIKIVNFARAARSSVVSPQVEGSPLIENNREELGLPTLRSAGLSVTHHERAFALNSHLVDTKILNQQHFPNPDSPESFKPPQDPLYLFLGDILRGYRVDIFDETMADKEPKWRSLSRRMVKYYDQYPDGNISPFFEVPVKNPPPDEGYVKAVSATSEPDDGKGNMYLHESLFRWDGWSLCARRPGKTIFSTTEQKTDGDMHRLVQHDSCESYPPTPARVGQFRSEWNKSPNNNPQGVEHPKGLKLYTIIDAEPGSLPLLRFGHRYRLRVRTVDLAGNSEPFNEKWNEEDEATASKIVLYTRFDPVPPPSLVPNAPLVEGEGAECMMIHSDHTTTERYIVPPRISQNMAEIHGMFDAKIMSGHFKDAYNDAIREGNTLENLPDNCRVTENGKILYYKQIPNIPYLPEPMGQGASFRGLPGAVEQGIPGLETASVVLPDETKECVLKVPFVSQQTTWPDGYESFLIKLQDGQGAPAWDNRIRVLTVKLPKAWIVRVPYSCYLNKEDRKLMGTWEWMEEEDFLEPVNAPSRQQKMTALQTIVDAGAHWMVTSFRTLLLVHAVKQPLVAPEFTEINLNNRKIGDTFVIFGENTKAKLCAKSTGKVDVYAEWKEDSDTGKNGPAEKSHQAYVCEVPIGYPATTDLEQETNVVPIQKCRHEFRDTRHRIVDYHLIATTRFREFFPVSITEDLKNITRPGRNDKKQVKKVNILSSARPAAPRVLYIVPTFCWELTLREEWKEVHTRKGGGLRVYLDRPWYSSGDGELLGVVLTRDPKLVVKPKGIPTMIRPEGFTDRLKPYISQCGIDPIWLSGMPKTPLRLSHFQATQYKDNTNPTLVEIPDSNRNVAVAAYTVEFDPTRKLWFCDIEIDPGLAYYPFVRLALVRYQPDSIQDAHISPVVLTDFAQLTPDRSASVTPIEGESRKVNVGVSGIYPTPTPYAGETAIASSRISCGDNSVMVGVRVELPDERIADQSRDSELGWITSPQPGLTMDYVWLSPRILPNSQVHWTGTVTLPFDRKTGPMRLSIEEFEEMPYEREPGVFTIGTPRAKRLVFADRFPL